MKHLLVGRQASVVSFASVFCLLTTSAFAAVTGKFLGNGQAAQLGHAVAQSADPWQDEPTFSIVLCEKDPATSENHSFYASFGHLGHALTIRITESGQIIGTEVAHQALERAGFSTVGSLKVEDFAIANGTLRARFYTEGPQEFAGETWEVDLRVEVALPK